MLVVQKVNGNMWGNFMSSWDDVTNIKKLIASIKKDIEKFKEKFYKNLKRFF
jgi:hypothetical protein